MGLNRISVSGWTWTRIALVGGSVLVGCLPIGPAPGETRNRLREELAAIAPIAPLDTAKAFLDSGTLSFETGQPNVFEYEGVREQSQGGLGPNFSDLHLTVKTSLLGDSLDISGTGDFAEVGRIPLPPFRYRKDTLPPTLLGTWNTPRRVYPSHPSAPWGLFLTNDGRRMLYLTVRYRLSDFNYTEDRLLYLEPYGLIYARIDRSQPMHNDYLEAWLVRWNGEALDRQEIFGMAKGLIAAYPAGPLAPPPL